MKKHIFKLAAIAAIAAIAVLPSCKKDDDNKTKPRSEMIVGTWKSDQQGEDTNGNGVWDTNERNNFDSSESGTFTFNANGSGSIYTEDLPVSIPLAWSLQNGDNDLRVITTFGTESDTVTLNIVTLTEASLVLKQADETPVNFVSFKK